MKTSKRVFIGLIVLLIVGIIGAGFVGHNYFKAKRVSRAVLSLPLGSSKAQVLAFLKSEGLEPSFVGDKEGIDFTSAVADNKYTSADLSGYVVAIIRNTSVGFIVSGDVQYFFFFDKKGKLLKATAEEVFTGP